MSSFAKRISKAKKLTPKKEARRIYRACKTYTSFNVFTKDGENIVVHTKTPMTVNEAKGIYHCALCIGGIE